MPCRLMSVAVALAAPLLLAACEQEAQQETEVGQAEEPAPAETEAARPTEPAPPATAQPPRSEQAEAPAGADRPREQDGPEQAGEEEILVVPPAGQAAQSEDGQPAQAPGEPSPEAAGVASVAAYVGSWAAEPQMCRGDFWTFTNLRLQSPDDFECDIRNTEEREDGLTLDVACTDRDDPLAEPDQHTMVLTFPNMPQTDTMVVRGGPVTDDLTLTRCQVGEQPAAGASPEPQNR